MMDWITCTESKPNVDENCEHQDLEDDDLFDAILSRSPHPWPDQAKQAGHDGRHRRR